MKIAPGPAKRADPRMQDPLPLVIDDAGLARQVQSAPTAKDAWDLLGLPGGRDAISPDAIDALAAAVTALCATSDSIGKGLKAFGALSADAEIPPAWIERMVTLHVEELEGYWRLDDLAYEGLKDGGWTATTPGQEPPVDDPGERRAVRARWQVEHLLPRSPVLAIDKARRALDQAVANNAEGADEEIAAIEEAGRALVQAVARARFARWQQVRQERGHE